MTSEGDSETMRLRQADAGEKAWRRWGPYLSERQWGTVREDYSANGDAWAYLPHEAARSHAYRWGEDGLGGFCDDQQNLCLCVALWNGKDPILKERLFGLTNAEGNHGEDVKELYYYLDATPTYSYARMLYKYPQAAYPYDWLVAENRRRGRQQPEFELIDTGMFDEDKYFDVDIEYAKADVDDILLRITVTNRGRRSGANHRPAASLVSQHVELVQGRQEAVARRRWTTAPSASNTKRSARSPCTSTSRKNCCSATTKPTRRSCSARPTSTATSRTPSTSTWCGATRAR